MSWFKRKNAGIQTHKSQQNEVPDGQWVKCGGCNETVNRRELERHLLVCPKCNYHFKMGSSGYFSLLFDEEAYSRHDENLVSVDRLEFTDRKPYKDRLVATRKKSGLNDAAAAATGKMGGHDVSIAAMDFGFIGGSMGSVVGEIVARAIKRGYENEMAVVVITQSGGARMMEGALSLMQMAKTSAHLTRLSEAGLPFFVVLTNPTTGGVTASFAMLGDVHLAEPGALIGFAGPRVIRETMGQDLPSAFQTSEFLREHGFVDLIVQRRDMKDRIVQLLDLFMTDEVPVSRRSPAAADSSQNGQQVKTGRKKSAAKGKKAE